MRKVAITMSSILMLVVLASAVSQFVVLDLSFWQCMPHVAYIVGSVLLLRAAINNRDEE